MPRGSGKSTAAALLADFLALLGLRTAILSIDDLYLTRSARGRLAREVHPLLVTRGVPGTHDLDLGVRTIDALCALRSGQRLPLPCFDKSTDDRLPPLRWPAIEGPVDIILFEGWCAREPIGA